jgi:hypothetical protein
MIEAASRSVAAPARREKVPARSVRFMVEQNP